MCAGNAARRKIRALPSSVRVSSPWYASRNRWPNTENTYDRLTIAMIKSIQCDTSRHAFTQSTNLDQIATFIGDAEHVLWLDMLGPTEQELEKIAAIFHLHPLAVEDAGHEHQRPKIEQYEHFDFLVFHTLNLDATGRTLVLGELDMFVGQNYLITVHAESVEELGEVEQRWRRNSVQLERGAGILLYSLLDTIVDHYFPVADELVDQAEALEERMFTAKGTTRERRLT